MKRYISLLLLLALSAPPARAEEAESLQSSVSRQVRGALRDSFLTFSVENDLFGGGTDRNYTSGVRMTYHKMNANLPAFAHAVDAALPTFSINPTTSVYYSLGQSLYTPQDITLAAQDVNDRPWAAFLYASAGLNSITRNHVDDVEVTLGVVGPAAQGEETQTFIHKYISDSPAPRGWDNQLRNEPALMLSWERSWPSRYTFSTLGWTGTATPHLGATLGNVYTYAGTGLNFSLSPYGRWQDNPVRVRPAMPGRGAFIAPEDTFNWYLFGGAEGRAVARNIFLDGNTFSDSYHVDKEPLVADASAGVAITYRRTRLSYALVYRTKEFKKQHDGDVFGTISLGIRF